MLKREIPDEIHDRRATWKMLFYRWRAIHYSIGLFAIITSISVTVIASQPIEELSQKYNIGLGLLSSILSGILTFLSPANNYRAYVQAWRHLDAACLRFQADPDYPLTQLVEAVNKGEEILGKENN